MSIDLSKLSPAPWLRSGKDIIGPIPDSPENTGDTDKDFICLARWAFEVMMRRGWGVQAASGPGWHPGGVEFGWQAMSDDNRTWIGQTTYSDPFTALVEADHWYRENVEARKT